MIRLTALLLLIAGSLWAQKKHVPPGYSWVSQRNLLVGMREVSCQDWLDFLAATGQDAANLPTPNSIVSRCIYTGQGDDVVLREESAIYRDTSFIDPPKGKKIHAVERCSNMPVTGITIGQARAYCEWLSDSFADQPKYASLKLTFRLATPAEMDSLLRDIFSVWKKGEENYEAFVNGFNKHGCALYNHRHSSWCETNILMKKEFGYGVPMQEGIFFPDTNGLLDLMGNVAEMTNVPGIAKGGSCIHTAAECQPGTENKYEGPQVWLGFRVVADLRK